MFRMCCFNDPTSAHMTLPDMVILLQAVTQGIHRLGITQRAPHAVELAAVANQMFTDADLNLDGEVGLAQFTTWAHNNVQTHALLHHFTLAMPPCPIATKQARYAAAPSAVVPRSRLRAKLQAAGRRSSMETRTAPVQGAAAGTAEPHCFHDAALAYLEKRTRNA